MTNIGLDPHCSFSVINHTMALFSCTPFSIVMSVRRAETHTTPSKISDCGTILTFLFPLHGWQYTTSSQGIQSLQFCYAIWYVCIFRVHISICHWACECPSMCDKSKQIRAQYQGASLGSWIHCTSWIQRSDPLSPTFLLSKMTHPSSIITILFRVSDSCKVSSWKNSTKRQGRWSVCLHNKK